MTVSSVDPQVIYSLGGVATEFPFTFSVGSSADVKVYHRDAITSLDTLYAEGLNYTIALNTPDIGGTVTRLSFAATGSLVIVRETELSQETSWVNGSPFDVRLIEADLDKSMRAIQDVYRKSQNISDLSALTAALQALAAQLVTWMGLFDPVAPIRFFGNTVTMDTTISGMNALSVGPLTIAEGISVTVVDDAAWTIV